MMHEDPLQFLGGVTSRGPWKAATSMAKTAGQEFVGRVAPHLKIPVELVTGRSLWQYGPRGGRALADQYGYIGGLAGQILDRPVKLPPVIEQIPQALGAGRWLSSIGKAVDPRKTIPQKAVNLLTGARLTTVTPEQQEKVIGETIDEMMTDLGARQFEILHFPDWYMQKLPPAEQQKRRDLQNLRNALDKRRRENRMRKAATQP